MSKGIILTPTNVYRDGGSISYVDEQGNKYWRSFKFGERNKWRYKKLFKGNINDELPELAEGTFTLLSKKPFSIKTEIITQ